MSRYQPYGETRLPEQLLNGGVRDTTTNIAHGLESAGVPVGIAGSIGGGYAIAVVVVVLFLLVRFYKRVGLTLRPPKKKGKRRR